MAPLISMWKATPNTRALASAGTVRSSAGPVEKAAKAPMAPAIRASAAASAATGPRGPPPPKRWVASMTMAAKANPLSTDRATATQRVIRPCGCSSDATASQTRGA